MAKIPVILEAGRADGKLIKTNSVYDDNQEKFLSDKIKDIDNNHNNLTDTVNSLTDIVNNNELDIENKLEAEQNRATNAENNLRETINNITEISGSATTANIVTIDTIPNSSSSNVQQALNELFKADEKLNTAIEEEKAAIIGTNRIAERAVTIDKIANSAIDDEPTVGSDNLVKSDGVARIIGFPMTLSWEAGGIDSNTGYDFFDEKYLTTRQRSGYISVNYIDTIIGVTSTFEIKIYQYNASKNYLQCSTDWISKNKYVFTEELDYDCKYIRICSKTIDSQLPPIQLENSKALLERIEKAEDNISNLQDSVGKLDNITDELLSLDNTINSIRPIWQAGGIDSNTGIDYNNSNILTTRQRTVGYINANYNELFWYEKPFDYIIYQYNSNHEFIAVASADWETSDKQFTFDASCKYIRITSKTIDSAKPTFALKNSNKNSVVEDLAKVEVKVESINNDMYSVSEHNTPNVYWETGDINSNTGNNNDDSSLLTTRQRTVGYISINDCDKVTNYSSPFDYSIMQYAEDKSFIGAIPTAPEYWKTSDWSFGSYLNENCKYIRICSKTTNSATPTLILKKTAEKGVKEKVTELEGTVTNLSKYMYGSEERDTAGVEWQAGGINSNTGIDYNNSNILTTRQRTIGYIPVSECNKVSNYSFPFDYCIFQYNSNKEYLEYIPSNIWKQSDWVFKDELNTNCAFIRICAKTTDCQTPTLVLKKTAEEGVNEKVEKLLKEGEDTIIVDAEGNGDYISVADALANASDTAVKHVTIIVRQGTYLMPPKVSGVAPYEENNRNLTIKGDDKYLCVLYNNIGFYDYTIGTDCTPLRLNGNVRIENLTIISRSTEFDNYVNTEGYVPRDDYRKASYCIHRDGHNPANTKFIVKDCILIDDHMTCIGFGLKPNTELIIENVYAQSEQAAEHSKANDYGTIYGHYNANSKGLGQDLSIIRCQLVNKTSNQAINIMDAKASDATPQDTFGTFKFIGNAVNTTDKTSSLVISRSIAGFYEIDGLSFDNAWE